MSSGRTDSAEALAELDFLIATCQARDEPFPSGDWHDLSDDELEEPKGGWGHIAYKAAALMVLRAQRQGASAKKFTSILHKVWPLKDPLGTLLSQSVDKR